LPAHPADGGDAEMQSGASEHLGDLDLAQACTQSLQALHGVAHEVRKLVDRLTNAQQGCRPFFIEAIHPRRDGRRRDMKDPRRLRQ
jgi:hypothetical protein